MTATEENKYSCFTPFKTKVEGIALPDKFTFPFYYEPHELSKIATRELQKHIENQTDWHVDFHNKNGLEGTYMGKMFGVLVVKNSSNELGYLSAFSGKLAGKNILPGFVPPVYDMLEAQGFFLDEMKILNSIIDKIKAFDEQASIKDREEDHLKLEKEATADIKRIKALLKENKKARQIKRTQAQKELSEQNYAAFDQKMIAESLKDKRELKHLSDAWKEKLEDSSQKLDALKRQRTDLLTERKNKSAEIQRKLFREYAFLNANSESKNLLDIFEEATQTLPPAAAGECAAPKLLQYAYLHNLQPIAMAEFWYGQSPKAEVRKHGHFYPACKGKCEPILGHMLKGLDVEPNPMLEDPQFAKEIDILYEDEAIVVINKPHEFLSVPGKTPHDSVASRMRERYPDTDSPLIVHRLDMSTSGIMIIAKTMDAYKKLQSQFIKRKVKKRYVALLEGSIDKKEGSIELPLRVDLDDRPRQLVCFEYGKPAHTKYQVIKTAENRTLVYFYPLTGRTHQLRVHAAHYLGLNMPIVGDDLYGTKADRLHLHAESIEFMHPTDYRQVSFIIEAPFGL